jgi:hypothetical protein
MVEHKGRNRDFCSMFAVVFTCIPLYDVSQCDITLSALYVTWRRSLFLKYFVGNVLAMKSNRSVQFGAWIALREVVHLRILSLFVLVSTILATASFASAQSFAELQFAQLTADAVSCAAMESDDNIVWGTAIEISDGSISCTAAEASDDVDNIVWGTMLDDDDNIVWGTMLDDDDNIVWGTMLDNDDNIVWGTSVSSGSAY